MGFATAVDEARDLADEERAAVQALVDAASPEVLSLYALRNPPLEEVADEALPA